MELSHPPKHYLSGVRIKLDYKWNRMERNEHYFFFNLGTVSMCWLNSLTPGNSFPIVFVNKNVLKRK